MFQSNSEFVYNRLFWVLVLVMIPDGDMVKIKELRVPEVTRHGSAVVLDCDYTLNESADNSGLWIPGTKKPQGLGVLRDKLNLEYRASDDERTMHRALHIPETGAELTGEYTCVVSTFSEEDRMTKKMIVFVPEKNLHVRQGRNSLGGWSVTCSAEGVFPKPELSIRMSHEELNGTNVETHRNQETGLYDISAVAALPDGGPEAPVEFACELRLPDANYTVRREAVFYPGNVGTNASSESWMIISPLCFLFLITQYS
ncbi:uncharacterized protein CBL_10621 [Carabus blaptoides fortunei]